MLRLLRTYISKLFSGSKPNESTLSHYAKLQVLCDHHQAITISIDPNKPDHQSMVLKVDTTKHLLIIDELFPHVSNSAIPVGKTIAVSCETPSEQLNFNTQVIEHRREKANTSYCLALPKQLGHSHNRNAYRVYMDKEPSLKVTLQNDDIELSEIKITNLSTSGLKLLFDKNMQNKLSRGLFFDQAVIHLPDNYSIDCQIQIRNYYVISASHPHSVAGGSLNIKNPKHLSKLKHYLATVQRKQTRREQAS